MKQWRSAMLQPEVQYMILHDAISIYIYIYWLNLGLCPFDRFFRNFARWMKRREASEREGSEGVIEIARLCRPSQPTAGLYNAWPSPSIF